MCGCAWEKHSFPFLNHTIFFFSPVPRRPPSVPHEPGQVDAEQPAEITGEIFGIKICPYTAPLSWDISFWPKNCPALIQSPLSFFSPPSIWTGFNYNENMCCVIKTPMRVLSNTDSRFSPLYTSSSYWLCYNAIKVTDTVVGIYTPRWPPVSLICARPWESWLKDH